jgi:NTE family protein
MIEKFRMRARGKSVESWLIGFRRRGGLGARPDAPEIRQAPRKSKPWFAGLLGLLGLAACASTQVPMNLPLPGAAANQGMHLADANLAGGRSDLLVLISFSGGGKRSAAFGHGVLRGLRDLPLRGANGASTLLAEVDSVAGVSGGSFPAAHFGLFGEASFDSFPRDFLRQDIEAYIWGTYLLPWNWEWLVNPLYGTNDHMAEVYDRLIFRGATFADLARRGRPQVAINATDIAYGVPFSFLPGFFDLLCSDLGSVPIARAIAASNGFPVLFTPITLANHRTAACASPPPTRPDLARARSDYRTRQLAETIGRYLDPERTAWVHLMDGGIADNLALRATINNMLLVQSQAETFRAVLRPIRRLLVISVDGQAATNPRLPQQRIVNGLTQIFGAVSGTQIDNYNVETLMLAEAQIQAVVERVRGLRCAEAPVVDGRPCGDVSGQLVRISLSEFEDATARERLQAIPTGLTIPAADTDLLVQVGEAMGRDSAELRAFIAGIDPPVPAAVPPPPAQGRRR